MWRRWQGSRSDTQVAEWGRKGGEREKGGEAGRRRELDSAVCTHLLGNAPLAPPTSGGDCDVTRGTSRLLPPLRLNGTPHPSLATGWVLEQVLQPGSAFLRRQPGLRRQHRNALHPYKLGVALVALAPAGLSRATGPQSSIIGPRLGVSPPPGPNSAPAQAPPPSPALPVLNPPWCHAPRLKPTPKLLPRPSLPVLLSSQMLALSSVFSLVHLSILNVVLTHIALSPVLVSTRLFLAEVQS